MCDVCRQVEEARDRVRGMSADLFIRGGMPDTLGEFLQLTSPIARIPWHGERAPMLGLLLPVQGWTFTYNEHRAYIDGRLVTPGTRFLGRFA